MNKVIKLVLIAIFLMGTSHNATAQTRKKVRTFKMTKDVVKDRNQTANNVKPKVRSFYKNKYRSDRPHRNLYFREFKGRVYGVEQNNDGSIEAIYVSLKRRYNTIEFKISKPGQKNPSRKSFKIAQNGNMMAVTGRGNFEVISNPPFRAISNKSIEDMPERSNQITGVWESNNSIHTAFPMGNDSIVWVGMRKNARSRSGTWCNIFVASQKQSRSKSGYDLKGIFVDVPLGSTRGGGKGEWHFNHNAHTITKVGRGTVLHRAKMYPRIKIHSAKLTQFSHDDCNDKLDYMIKVRTRIDDRFTTAGYKEGTRNTQNKESIGFGRELNILHPWCKPSIEKNKPAVIVIEVIDDDDIPCGGTDDKVDISPDRETHKLFLMIDYKGFVYIASNQHGRGKRKVGRLGDLFTFKGDKRPNTPGFELAELKIRINN